MHSRTKWVLVGSGIGVIVATLVAGLALLIVRPNLQGMGNANVSSPSDPGGIPVGQVAPDFTVTDLSGNTVRLSDFRGRPILLKFWAPECPPCASEAIDLQQVYESQGNELVILTIAAYTTITSAQSFVSENQITYPVLPDEDGQLMNQYQVKGIPFTYLIDVDGIVQKKLAGTRSLDQLKKDITDFYSNMMGNVTCGSNCNP